jgi:hypothetical protein
VSAEIQKLKVRLNETGSLTDALALRKAQSAIPHPRLVYEARGAGLYKAERLK